MKSSTTVAKVLWAPHAKKTIHSKIMSSKPVRSAKQPKTISKSSNMSEITTATRTSKSTRQSTLPSQPAGLTMLPYHPTLLFRYAEG